MKSKHKGIIIIIIVLNLFIGSIVFATNGAKMIEVLFNNVNLKVNGETVEVDNITYNGTTYAPIRVVAEMLGKEVGWDGDTNTVSITDIQPFNIAENFILHGFYAIESNDQFNDFKRSTTLSNFDSISFGWSRIDRKDNEIQLLLSGEDSKDFYVPSGYSKTLDTAADNNISKQLMVFANDYKEYYFDKIFDKKETIVEQIVAVVNGENSTFSMLEFDGVTIDFETVKEENQEDFVEFLDLLKMRLKDKKLYVAVPPVNSYKYYLFKDIISKVDYMILMEHDFDDKLLQPGYAGNSVIETPLTPIDKIRLDVNTLISSIGKENSNKLLLQISFTSTQWGVKDGLLHSSIPNSEYIEPSNPGYLQIYNRINKEIKEKDIKLEELIHYNEQYQNPYMQYYNENYGIEYYIWYENSRSVIEKIKLAQEYDLAGVSLWRIGSIPNYYGVNGKKVGFDVWNNINELLKR